MKSQVQNLVFFGTSGFAVLTLKALIEAGYNIAAVITQPDKPAGRKQKLSPAPIKIFAEQHDLKILQPKTLRDDDIFETFKNLNPDICIIAAYGKIVPSRYLEIPKYGFLNIHPSLLPKYRGPSPIQTAILNGENETGVTVMIIDEEVDHGPILMQKAYNLPPSTYYPQAEKELAEMGARLLIKTLTKYLKGEIKSKPQDHSQAIFTKILSRQDGRINWNESAKKIYNQVRALNPEPGTWTTWNSRVINIPTLRVGYPQTREISKTPGLIAKTDKNIVVTAKDSCLELNLIQLEGGKKMTIEEFINGHRDFVGSILN